MKWFQVDSDAPNDPKLKAIIRKGGQAAAGATFLLWCYVANHGKGEPGLGIRTDGGPLSLDDMAGECLFDSVNDLQRFLDFAAERGHIHPEVWRTKRIVFLPAMWERVSAYYRSKARKVNFASSQDVARAALAGPMVGPRWADSALPTDQTNQTEQDQPKTTGPDLLEDAGPDQAEALVHLWNTERKPGPIIHRVTDVRKKAIQQRLKEHPNLDDWRKVIRWVNGQKWCNASGTGDHPNYRLDLDTLLKPGKFQSYLERAATERIPTGPDGLVGWDPGRGRTGRRPGEYSTKALTGQE